jgi:hypothetical protein
MRCFVGREYLGLFLKVRRVWGLGLDIELGHQRSTNLYVTKQVVYIRKLNGRDEISGFDFFIRANVEVCTLSLKVHNT